MILVRRLIVSFTASVPLGMIPAIFGAAVALDGGSETARPEGSTFSPLAASGHDPSKRALARLNEAN